MQALESDLQHAQYTRAALLELLGWGLTEREAQIFLNALLRFHASPEARLNSWRELAEAHEKFIDLDGGADPGFDDLGDGLCVSLDRETALQRAEAELDELLDAVAGISRSTRRQAA